MPNIYKQAKEGTQHINLHNFPMDIIEEIDKRRAHSGGPRRIAIINVLREALGLSHNVGGAPSSQHDADSTSLSPPA